jgi:glutamate carboxypeptidase
MPQFEQLSNRVLATLKDWVEIESPSHDREAVMRMATRAEADLLRLGAAIERIPGTSGFADILLGRLPGKTTGPGILLLGHLDTVHPIGTLAADLPYRVEGDRAYGPGIYDMKAGNVMALTALELLKEARTEPCLPVTVMFIPDEEMGSPTSRADIEREAKDHLLTLVVEPSGGGGQLTIARHGMARYRMVTTGRSAHAGAYHADGRSAIKEMAHQILAVESLTDYDRNISVNVGLLQGGEYENRVPDHCEATIYCMVGTTEVEAELRQRLLLLQPRTEGTSVEVIPGLFRPPFAKTTAIQAIYDCAKALAADLPYPVVGERVAGGGSDGNFTGALGLPTLDGLGAIGGGPHTLEEHVLISSLGPRTELLRRLFQTLGPDLAFH